MSLVPAGYRTKTTGMAQNILQTTKARRNLGAAVSSFYSAVVRRGQKIGIAFAAVRCGLPDLLYQRD
jgi:hypothetical protein